MEALRKKSNFLRDNEFLMDYVKAADYVNSFIKKVDPTFYKVSREKMGIALIGNTFDSGGVNPMLLARHTTLETEYAHSILMSIYFLFLCILI